MTIVASIAKASPVGYNGVPNQVEALCHALQFAPASFQSTEGLIPSTASGSSTAGSTRAAAREHATEIRTAGTGGAAVADHVPSAAAANMVDRGDTTHFPF